MDAVRTSSRRTPAILAFATLVASLLIAAPSAAFDDVGATALLGDGVDGLEINRTTAIESEVWAIEPAGAVMLVGGAFLEVRDRSTYAATPWPYLAAFDSATGEHIPWFNTRPDGPVYDIVDLGNGTAVLAGEFSTVNGVAGTDKLALIDTETGLVDTDYSFDFDDAAATVIRTVAVHNDWLYVAGAFNRANGNGVAADTRGVARFSLASGTLDTSWTPELRGGDAFGIAVADSGRVFVGGYFESVNGDEGTETLAAIEPVGGDLVAGWNHGFPSPRCSEGWRDTCGAVNGMAVYDDRLFIAGAKHFWTAMNVSDGEILVSNEITNDGQSVDIVDDKIVIGCHCETATFSDEFNGIAHRYLRIVDPDTLQEIDSPTVNSRGAAGGWAAAAAPDGCLWGGGNFSSTIIAGTQPPAWNLLRFCPDVAGSGVALSAPPIADRSSPTTPSSPTVTSVRGSSVDLTWTAAADDSGQTAYLVYRNGALVGRTSTTAFADKLLDYSTTYVWQIAAVDMAGNQTELSVRSTPVRIGQRINIATGATATQLSDDNESTTADRAIDGALSTNAGLQMPSRTGDVSPTEDPWINLDLGNVFNVDAIELHPRRDDAFRESNNRPRVFYDTVPVTADNRADAAIGGHSVWIGDVARADAEPRIDLAPIAEPVQHVRIFGSLKQISFDEIRVFTAAAEPTPAMPALDTAMPTDPRWSRIVQRGDVSVLEWGGASDDTGVAYYEVEGPDDQFWRTTTTRLSVARDGTLARDYQIVVVDAAGNRSRELVAASPIPECSVSLDGELEVDWTRVDGADRYIIRRSVDGGLSFWRGAVDRDEARFTDSNRAGELIYTVEARFGAVATEPTVCEADVAGAPTGLRVTREENRLVVINYAGNGRRVEIERDGVVVAVDGDDWYVDSGLEPGRSYSYRVRFEGSGQWSEAVDARTTGAVLGSPAACSLDEVDDGFAVSWTAVASADAYVVERRVDGGTWWWRGRTEQVQFDDSNRSGTIEYRVRAVDAASNGPNRTCTQG